MRIALALVVTGCSFSRGLPEPWPSDGSLDVPIDIPVVPDGPGDGMPDASPDAATAICPAGYATVANAPATSKYKAFPWASSSTQDRSANWDNARSTCANEGTHLAIINHASEATALLAALNRDPGSPYMWHGLTDSAVEGTWLTVLNTPAPYLAWASGQPNGGASANCALLGSSGGFYDWTCGSAYPFLCECE